MILNHVRLVKELSSSVSTESGYVRIENGIIAEVSKKPYNVTEDNGEKVTDCGGKTLLPGLIDLHTHITVLNQVGFECLHSDMELLTTAAKHATAYLDMGFTTIRDCGSIHRVANEVKHMVQIGLIDAPDLITCGRAIMPTEGSEKHMMAQHVHFADTADEVKKAARQEMAEGADFVKIFASGAAAIATGVPQQSIMFQEEIEAAVKTAERKGCYVAAHCHADEAIKNCIHGGVRTIEHATLISDETLELAAKSGSYLVPTLAVMYVSDGPRKAYWEKRLGPMFGHCTEKMAKAYEMGMYLGFGTDCSAGDYCYDNGIEFKFRKENCGMKDLDILLQCTRNNAVIAGIEDKVGQIRKGLVADMILVDGKPDKDISCMYHKPDLVIKRGKVVRILL